MNCFSLYKAILLCLFIILNCNTSFSQIVDFDSEKPYKKVFEATDNFGASYLEVLENNYTSATVDSVKFSMLNDLAYYTHTRNLFKAMHFTKEGLKETRRKKNLLWEGRFQITQGALFLRMEKLDSAEIVLNEALTKVHKKDLPLLKTQLGYVYERRGLLEKAADYALETKAIGEEIGDKWAMATAYSDLSNLFWKQSKSEIGLEYGLKSLAIFEERGLNDLDYDFTLYVVGNNYLSLKKYDKALHYLNHSIAIGERYGFYNNLSDGYILLAELHSNLNEFDEALKAAMNALKYAELLHNNFLVMRSWMAIGKIQNLNGDFVLAIESLENCIKIATSDFGDAYFLSKAYNELGKANAAIFQYEEAYKAFEKYDTFKSAVFTAEADHRTSQLRTEYEVTQKNDTIENQESQLKRQRSQQLFITIIAALLLLLLILGYIAFSNNRKRNKLLLKQNEEKAFLLKEIHHRVKNNLEIISSLLSLQSAQIEDQNVLNAMEESQHRVQSMSMIHQKLYMGENLAAIEMKGYFGNLADYILNAFGAEDKIKVDVAMENFELDVDIAIPIGLIVNELITNSLKYAFPNNKTGCISVSLEEKGTILQLNVTDNGIGMSDNCKPNGTGFGSQLIQLLTKQLDGKMVLNTKKGTSVSIKFQYKKAA
ncbi:histidine kinase dimerization/phosphoacceptor domain -containing protein [Aurantibacter sp.]|uniref:sensor histidine kinase n=1 Tax=Aurantibacter sp. TaxID=2807103 RepID=UPI00326750EE